VCSEVLRGRQSAVMLRLAVPADYVAGLHFYSTIAFAEVQCLALVTGKKERPAQVAGWSLLVWWCAASGVRLDFNPAR
jgi:hypothetical protein